MINNKLYKKQKKQDILNYGLSEKAINRKKTDLLMSLTALLFDIQFGKSTPGTIKPFNYLERNIEMIMKANNIPVFMENEGILSNINNLIIESETNNFIQEFNFKQYLVGSGRRVLLRTDMKDAGYNSFTIKEAEKLYTITQKIMHIHKELDRRNYQGIKAPSKGAIDNVQKLINILIVNDR
jgi:hypothetical protein